MRYYYLTHDVQHGFVDERLFDLLDGTQVVTAANWTRVGGGHLSPDSPPHELWGARPGHLLVDSTLRDPWIERFGGEGVLDTVLGARDMFAVVPDGAAEGAVPNGNWREHHYFHTRIWPADGMPGQKHSLALRFDLRTPVVRPWAARRAGMTLYSEEVLSWLRSQGASGVSFTLVWDPERAAPLPLTEPAEHETVTL